MLVFLTRGWASSFGNVGWPAFYLKPTMAFRFDLVLALAQVSIMPKLKLGVSRSSIVVSA